MAPPPDTAPPVLLVHGFASSFERNWREPGWVDLLADAGRVVRHVDLLGHGTAERPHDPTAYADLARPLHDILDADGEVDAVGFSMGAALLLDVAAARPGALRRVVLGGLGDRVFRPLDATRVARAVETGEVAEGDPPIASAMVRFASGPGNDPAALAACLRRPTTPLTPADLAAVDLPVLIVLGDRDPAGPADRLLAALPDARLVTLTGTDHFATPRDFRFVDATLDFLGAG